MAQFRQKVSYGLSDALINDAPYPIQALRAPTTADIGYLPGTIWVDKPASSIYILASVIANDATWLSSGGGPGVFTNLSNTGTIQLAEVGPTTNFIGNIDGATSLTLFVGTGGFQLAGVGASDYVIGSSATTGQILIGGATQSGDITLGESSVANVVDIGVGTGDATISIGGTGDNIIGIGDVQTAGDVSIGGLMTTGTISIGGSTQTGAIFLGGSTASQSIIIGNGGGGNAKTILIGTGAAANVVNVGSTNTIAATTINAGSGGVFLNAPFVELPGPIYIYTGAGAPGNGLALHAGDMYINTTPTGATDRLFIATAASTWTNVTCAA